MSGAFFPLAGAPLAGLGADSGTGTSYSWDGFSIVGVPTNTYVGNPSVTSTAAIASSTLYRLAWLLSEGIQYDATLTVSDLPNLIERFSAAETLNGSNAIALALADSGAFADPVLTALAILLADSGALTSPLASVYAQVPALEETLLALGLVETRQDANLAVIEALVLLDLTESGWAADALATATVADALAPVITRIMALAESAALESPATNTLVLTALIEDSPEAAATVTTTAQLFEYLTEGAAVFVTVRLGDAEYSCFVLNTASKAVVEYQNFPFNSFARFNGRYFGASELGLYELTGEDDDGDPIDAWVRTALTTLGTGKKKRVPSMYLGYTADGGMVLKVVTTREDGAKIEDWYELTERTATAPRENRFKIGRGLQSVYWAFEIHNQDGADFTLEAVDWFPMILDRRL